MIDKIVENLRFIPIIIGIVFIIIYFFLLPLGLSLKFTNIYSAVAIPVLGLLMANFVQLEKLHKGQRKYEHKIELLSDLLHEKTNDEACNDIRVSVLESTFDFYRACNLARERSEKKIHLMKIHNVGPQDKDSFIDKGVVSSSIGVKAENERACWYSGLRDWNKVEGRYLERITVKTDASIQKFIKEVDSNMKGTNYTTHIMPWDGEMPVLNLCVFDEYEVIFNFSTRRGEAPYAQSNIAGMSIKSHKVSNFFYRRYYERMVQYSRKS